ncbi:uncharacterized protein PAC_16812 [Phialocephala subalpina]|uniref:2EXR domain-containing protein n=1 Tax=Phialocephala subalpina TaxID=576137 RepID=A0A1L7XPD5_9HELO|nr:uncharacterized protein PAC_16812 [Phialocephala subalpina]
MDYSQIPPADHQHWSLVQIPTPNTYQYPNWRRRAEGDHPWPGALMPPNRFMKIDRCILESFHLFSKFPTEIRLNVWRFTCFPRVVEVQVIEPVRIPDKTCSFVSFHTRSQLPAAFSVCTESRAVVLPFYKLCFGSALRQDLAPSTIYFNPDVDTLFFKFDQSRARTSASKHALKAFIEHSVNTQCGHERLDMQLVKRIAISHRAVDRSNDFAELVPHLGFLARLEELIVVAEREEVSIGSQVVLSEPEARDPGIALLQKWVDHEFTKNQSYAMAWRRENIAGLVAKVMEAEYERMYPPPPRRPLEDETKALKDEEVEAPEPGDEATTAAEDWSSDLFSSLDLLSFN